MTSMIPAYIEDNGKEHVICSQCPDSEYTQKTVKSMEQKRELEHMAHGIYDYVRKGILLTICDTCIEKKEKEAIVD